MSGSYYRFSADQSRAEELATQNEMGEALTALMDAPAGSVSTTGSPASGNLAKFSGANSIVNGDLSGDVTTSGTLAVTIANGVVTLAKIANAAANSKLLGSGASGSGSSYVELTLGTNLSMSGTTLNASGGGGGSLADGDYGDITVGGTGTTLTIDNNAVTNAKLNTLTGSTGMVAQTGANAYSARTITGTANNIAVTNGNGVSGNPTITLDQATGAWTPVVAFGGASVGVTYAVQVGRYIRTGNLVMATCHITLTNNGSSTGSFTITGLPFTSKNTANQYHAAAVFALANPAGKNLQFWAAPNSTVLSCLDVTNGSLATEADVQDAAEFIITLTYECEP